MPANCSLKRAYCRVFSQRQLMVSTHIGAALGPRARYIWPYGDVECCAAGSGQLSPPQFDRAISDSAAHVVQRLEELLALAALPATVANHDRPASVAEVGVGAVQWGPTWVVHKHRVSAQPTPALAEQRAALLEAQCLVLRKELADAQVRMVQLYVTAGNGTTLRSCLSCPCAARRQASSSGPGARPTRQPGVGDTRGVGPSTKEAQSSARGCQGPRPPRGGGCLDDYPHWNVRCSGCSRRSGCSRQAAHGVGGSKPARQQTSAANSRHGSAATHVV